MFFNPVNEPANVIATGTVRFEPDVVTTPPPPEMVHWLFDKVPLPPGVIEPATNPVLASLSRCSWLLAGRYATRRLLGANAKLPKSRYVTYKSEAPFESAKTTVKVWTVP